jgi:hypothetical protein
LNQGMNKAMLGANGVNNFGAEGAGGTAGGANMGNMGGDERADTGDKKHGIGVASGGVTRNASTSGDGTTGSAEKATRAHRRRTKILSAVPFC